MSTQDTTTAEPQTGEWVNAPNEPAEVAVARDPDLDQETTQQLEVMQRETYFTTQRALRVEAKAREMKAYYQLAQSLSKTAMVKESYQWNGITNADHPKYDLKPVQNLAAAMMFGAKLGIEPEDAGLLVIMIKNSPSLEAKTMVGIIRSWCDKRVAQGRTKTYEEGGDWIWEVSASDKEVVWAARRDGDEKSCAWSIARADNAGYTEDIQTQNGTRRSMYKSIPIEMLRARAQSEVARLLFSDVLRGMQYSAEEMELVERTVNRPVEQPVRPGKGMAALEQHVQQGGHMAAYGGETIDGEVVAPDSPPDAAQGEAGPVGGATEGQLTPVHIKLGEVGITERAEKLLALSALVDRKLTSSKQLTPGECAHIVAVLNQWKDQARANLLQLIAGDTSVMVPPVPQEKASTGQLRKLINAYKKAGIVDQEMLDHITGVVGWTCDDINRLTEDDANDCINKLATHG